METTPLFTADMIGPRLVCQMIVETQNHVWFLKDQVSFGKITANANNDGLHQIAKMLEAAAHLQAGALNDSTAKMIFEEAHQKFIQVVGSR